MGFSFHSYVCMYICMCILVLLAGFPSSGVLHLKLLLVLQNFNFLGLAQHINKISFIIFRGANIERRWHDMAAQRATYILEISGEDGGGCRLPKWAWQTLSKKPQCNLKLQLAIKHGSRATKDAHLVLALEIYGT